ncbi:hybrid sensor histidine kinase/response regulator [Sandaracinus amylolyticus]|uniref:histidine kinase n=1 Tax=Sandaracinus amylolyticus TaxID=927083 RepID=A0A0F6W4X3_9BACT|nr:hybrid sensor histidine kinase/response regulator [Sandaracinus amylolyticus]AKF07517.1 two-component sensor histidine kinase [Sandaracinus amylolyticus]
MHRSRTASSSSLRVVAREEAQSTAPSAALAQLVSDAVRIERAPHDRARSLSRMPWTESSFASVRRSRGAALTRSSEIEIDVRIEKTAVHPVCPAPSCPPRSERRRVQAMASAGIAVFEWSPNGDRLHVEGALHEGVEGATCRDALVSCFDPAQRAALARALEDAARSQQRIEMELRVHGRDEWLLLRGEGRAEPTPHVIGALVDVTDAKRRSEALAQALEAERASRHEAERVNRAHEEFVAMLSHELRGPLSAVLGWAQILRSGACDQPTLAKAIEVIERNARAQERIVSDLLDVARALAGKLLLDRGRLRVADPVRVVVEGLRAAAERAQVELSFGPIARDAFVLADVSRVEQIVSNLVSNALKFTPPGGRVRVSVERTTEVARIVVEDTGRGLDAEVLPVLFVRWRQVRRSDSKRGGLGLGLSIVKQLVELHEGRVSATSEGVGRGSTFVVELPLVGVTERPDAVLAPMEASTALAGRRVLLVDEDRDAVELASRALRASHAEVVATSSEDDAWRELESGGPWDVLVAELGAPDERGRSLVHRWRLRERETGAPHLPALCASVYARAVDRQRALDAGFDEHVVKPVASHALVAAVASLVSGARVPR